MRRVIQAIAVLTLIGSVAWFIAQPGFEPVVTGLGSLAALISLFVGEKGSKGKEADRKLFDELKKALPSNGSIAFIDEFNMAGFSFDMSRLDDLYNFANTWRDAEHEFLDKELNDKLTNLHKFVAEYTHLVSNNTFINHRDRHSVPPEWEYEQPERFQNVVKQLHDKAGEIVKAHQDLIRIARNKLEQ